MASLPMYMELKRLEQLKSSELPQVASPFHTLGQLTGARQGHVRIRGFNEALETCTDTQGPWGWNHKERGYEQLRQKVEQGDWVLVLDKDWPLLTPAFQQTNGQWEPTHYIHQPTLHHRFAIRLQALSREQRSWDVLHSSNQTNDAEIEALNLAETARKAAYLLKKAHPSVKFTSGRRNKGDQARAMASNVKANRKWIEQTYSTGPLRKKCQEWVDINPDKKTQAEIAEGLLSVFNAATDAELGKFSKHLSGQAFDVQPVSENAEAIKKTIRGLASLDKFLDTEGGLVRWHAQFK